MIRPNKLRSLFARRPATTRKPVAHRTRLNLEAFEDRIVPAQFSGAIYDTDITGKPVNQNIYDAIKDVYLNGGPQNQNSNGLPDGIYFFQVTDPSGATLLSTSPAETRMLRVTDGRISGAFDPDGVDGPIVPHKNGDFNNANGSTAVQLFPFNPTPNNGEVYKVWLIPAGKATIGEGEIILTFASKDAKTDNFKVKVSDPKLPVVVTLSGVKYYDQNANGIRQSDTEPAISDWVVYLDDDMDPTNGFIAKTQTDTTGGYSFTIEDFQIGMKILDAIDTYHVYEGTAFESGYVGNWVQTGGVGGYTFNLGANGNLAGGQPRFGDDLVAVNALDFGNVKLGAGGGHTLGFWSNKNGMRAMEVMTGGMNATLAYLNSLNLRDASGAKAGSQDATPGFQSYAEFRTWLLGASATNMSYMLSAQMAAMALNIRATTVSGDSLIHAPGVTGANPAGFITANKLVDEANMLLSDNPVGNPDRGDYELVKNALDDANNNRNFVVVLSPSNWIDENSNGVIDPNEII